MLKCCCPCYLEIPLSAPGFILVSPFLVLVDIRALNQEESLADEEKGKHSMKEHIPSE